MPTLDERVAAATAKLRQLKIRQQRTEARKRSIALKNQRSQDVRRKILVGAIVLARVEAGDIPKGDFLDWLEVGLTRDDDRALFNLPPRATP